MPLPPKSSPRLALIAAIVGAAALIFAWVGGWLTPNRVSGDRVADLMEGANGRIYPGFRRAHAKGACATGRFESNGAGAALSRAALFAKTSTPVIARFSTGGGSPIAPDGRPVFRALGLRFALPGGEEWRMAIDHTPIFVVGTPADFVALQAASKADPKTGKPDPAVIGPFVAAHPETAAFLDYLKTAPLPSSFANSPYYSINAFRFIDAAGKAQAVRWQFEPETPFAALDPATLDKQPPDFLFDDLLARAKQGPIKWRMVVILANPGDRTDNATVRWTGPHRQIEVGTLILDRATTEVAGDCRDYNYDPLILPKGVEASDDPLLPARSAAYSASFRRRAIEGPRPDAVTIDHAKGAAQ